MTRQSGVYLDASYASQSPSGAGHYSWKPKLSDGGRLEIVQFISKWGGEIQMEWKCMAVQIRLELIWYWPWHLNSNGGWNYSINDDWGRRRDDDESFSLASWSWWWRWRKTMMRTRATSWLLGVVSLSEIAISCLIGTRTSEDTRGRWWFHGDCKWSW